MIYDNIKKIARNRNISVYRIEKDLDFSNGLISKWNKSIPTITMLKKVADYLSVSLEELLEED
ncbi:TPA: helix-turn-helix domain-containing protein [Streptococcus suis]